MKNDLRIIIIKENGNMVTIFSSENNECSNYIEANDIGEIQSYYNQIKNKVNKNRNVKDKHLFYLKDYLKGNYVKEFSDVGINPQNINDDILLYYLLSEFGEAVLVNSSEHINIAIIPNVGLYQEQLRSIEKVKKLFDDSINWEIADNMHFDIIEENKQKYRMLNVGETVRGNLEYLMEKTKEKRIK